MLVSNQATQHETLAIMIRNEYKEVIYENNKSKRAYSYT
jgi:hypothetical protein